MTSSSVLEPLLEARGLRVGYQRRPILPPLDFTLVRGQVTSIVGHNGSGKSTLLRTLVGLQPPVGGEIRFGREGRIGYVPQRESIDPIWPVRVQDLVETGRYGLNGVGRRLTDADREAVARRLEQVGATPLAHRLFRTLSGGEQQRVLLARALCADPTLLILDEPTASLDEKGATEVIDLTLGLAREAGCAVAMVNHHLDLVRRISDQVVRVDRFHQLVKVGTPGQALGHLDEEEVQ